MCQSLTTVWLFAIPWTVAPQASLSLGFSRQEYWSGLTFPSPGGSKSRSVVSDSLWSCGLYSPWNSPGQNTGVGSLSLLQGIFTTQGLNPGLLHCRWILYQLSHILKMKTVKLLLSILTVFFQICIIFKNCIYKRKNFEDRLNLISLTFNNILILCDMKF